jgi:hypothetical protein
VEVRHLVENTMAYSHRADNECHVNEYPKRVEVLRAYTSFEVYD